MYDQAKDAAAKFLQDAWKHRHQIWERTPAHDEIFPLDVSLILARFVGLAVEEPEEIGSPQDGIEIAGELNRELKRISLAQKFKPAWRLFTAAHELGHWILHPGLIHHRDRPVTGGERADWQRSKAELEADAFAAHVLMPGKPLRLAFLAMFGAPIGKQSFTEDFLFRFSLAVGQRFTAKDILSKGLRFRSFHFAQISSWDLNAFVPLHEQFGVSPTAMAIRLEELGLVR